MKKEVNVYEISWKELKARLRDDKINVNDKLYKGFCTIMHDVMEQIEMLNKESFGEKTEIFYDPEDIRGRG